MFNDVFICLKKRKKQKLIEKRKVHTSKLNKAHSYLNPANTDLFVIDDDLLQTIKKFEGYEPEIYKDGAGKLTIGYGHLLSKDEVIHYTGKLLSKDEVNVLLLRDVKVIARQVVNVIKVKLTKNQLKSLISFTFNVGIGNLKVSTLLKRLNAGKHAEAAEELLRWKYATIKNRHGNNVKIVLAGLEKRRKVEKKLFLKS